MAAETEQQKAAETEQQKAAETEQQKAVETEQQKAAETEQQNAVEKPLKKIRIVKKKDANQRMEKQMAVLENPQPPPKLTRPNMVKASPFYFNNRKKFLSEINRLFSKYRAQMADKEGEINCKTQTNQNTFELMTHQKVITDYLN